MKEQELTEEDLDFLAEVLAIIQFLRTTGLMVRPEEPKKDQPGIV